MSLYCDTPKNKRFQTSCFFLILVTVGYESVSAVIVLIIMMLLWFWWLPQRTVNSMKDMLKHREDKYSPSLHFVNEQTGSLCCQTSGVMRGVDMSQARKQRVFTTEYVSRVRRMRKAAVRRRRILVMVLAVVMALLATLGIIGLISLWFTLIPVALVVFVLYRGALVSAHARQWEAQVHRFLQSQRLQDNQRDWYVQPIASVVQDSHSRHEQPEAVDAQPDVHDIETSVMQQHEIRQALQRASHKHEGTGKEIENTDERQTKETSTVSNVSQELISFSFGSDDPQGPDSLPIQSTKQVTRATSKSTQTRAIEVEEQSARVQSEVVEAPVSSKDSLGNADVSALLARRSA